MKRGRSFASSAEVGMRSTIVGVLGPFLLSAALGAEAAAPPAAAPSKELARLIEELSNRDVVVRRRAAMRLGQKGARGRQAVPALVKGLGDVDQEVRIRAALALSKVGEPALPALIETVKSGDVY